jgi:hypothetical protein
MAEYEQFNMVEKKPNKINFSDEMKTISWKIRNFATKT